MSAYCAWCAKSITLEQAEKEGYEACCGFGFCSKECKKEHIETKEHKP